MTSPIEAAPAEQGAAAAAPCQFCQRARTVAGVILLGGLAAVLIADLFNGGRIMGAVLAMLRPGHEDGGGSDDG